jgi:SAM-dependent methyltransferase
MTTHYRNEVEAFKRFERDGYSKVAEAYDRATAPVTAQVNDAILDASAVGDGTRVLDVACGPGWLSAAAAKRGATVTGVDFAEHMLTVARARCPGGDFREGDAEALPFAGGRFDAVVCSLGFPHFPNPESAIAEAFRVLVPGGRFAFTNWTPLASNPFMRLILGSVQAHGTLDVDLPPGPPLFRFGDRSECERALATAGFEAVSITEVPMIWPFATAEAVVPEVIASTARLGPILAAQTVDQRARIEAAIVEGARAYGSDQGIAIPTSVLLAMGRRP